MSQTLVQQCSHIKTTDESLGNSSNLLVPVELVCIVSLLCVYSSLMADVWVLYVYMCVFACVCVSVTVCRASKSRFKPDGSKQQFSPQSNHKTTRLLWFTEACEHEHHDTNTHTHALENYVLLWCWPSYYLYVSSKPLSKLHCEDLEPQLRPTLTPRYVRWPQVNCGYQISVKK